MGSKADPRLSPSAAAAPAAAVLPVLQGGRAYRFASSLLLRLHAKREREEPQSQQPQRPWLLGGQGPRPAMCHPGNFTVPWGAFREDSAPAPGSAGFGSGSMPAAALFTPYHVTTGGGEKYLLSGRWLLHNYPRASHTRLLNARQFVQIVPAPFPLIFLLITLCSGPGAADHGLLGYSTRAPGQLMSDQGGPHGHSGLAPVGPAGHGPQICPGLTGSTLIPFLQGFPGPPAPAPAALASASEHAAAPGVLCAGEREGAPGE